MIMRSCLFAVAAMAACAASAEIRVGIIGLDTSHSIAFTKHLNVTREKPEYLDFRVVADVLAEVRKD